MPNWKEYNVKSAPKEGTIVKAKLTKVTEGKVRDFVTGNGIAAWGDKNAAAINLTALTPDGAERNMLCTLPKDKTVPGNSKLGKWNTKYGKFPEVGDEVELIADEKGFFQFLLE